MIFWLELFHDNRISEPFDPMLTASYFAALLLTELRKRDPRAASLRVQGRGKTAVIGFDDEGEFFPLFGLTGASPKFNVMSLLVNHRGKWHPTFKRGTPKELADPLAGELKYLWTIPLEMANIDLDQLG